MDVGDYLDTIRAALAAAGMDPAEREALLGAYASTGQYASCILPFSRVFAVLNLKLFETFVGLSSCCCESLDDSKALKLYSEDLIEMTI
jgi:hypothetical protein